MIPNLKIFSYDQKNKEEEEDKNKGSICCKYLKGFDLY